MAKRSIGDIEKIWSNVEGIKKLSDRAVGFGPFGVGLDGLLTWIPVVGTVYSVGASGWLLRFAAVRPGHATVITALCAAAMFACLLLLPGEGGRLAGAALFQLASIADGIDGEIARATFRTSKRGASWDSAVDAATNAGFFIGVGANYAMGGLMGEAALAFGTVAILLLGLSALGLRSVMGGEPLNFEAVKRRFKGSSSRWQTRLAAITGRDSYCFFIFLLALLGLIEVAMGIMLGAAIIWLVVVITALRADAGDQHGCG